MIHSAFLMPLPSQRYFAAINRIKQVHPRFFIDFGCAECDFIFYVSKHPDFLSFAVGVDRDDMVFKRAEQAFRGGIFYRHSRPFGVSLVKEDMTHLSSGFLEQYRNCPFVTCLEVIEHLTLDELGIATNELFGKLQPNYVYLTTPNIEYNNILAAAYDKERKYAFRHPDHKFEWTRAEFSGWCEHVCSQYGYSCEIGGIGSIVSSGIDDGTSGCASQYAFFTRNQIITSKRFDIPNNPVVSLIVDVDAYDNYMHGYTPQPTPEPTDDEYY